MEMKQMTLTDFVALTASDAPAPGGGSISALAGALAAALAGMVARLTVGKKGYEEHAGRMSELAKSAQALHERLLDDIQRDSESFNQFMDAMGMPKSTDEEKAARAAAMQTGLKAAAAVPLEVARTALEIMPLAREAAVNGNKNAITDAMVAAMMARSAAIGALYNVKINLGSIKDEEYVAAASRQVEELARQAQAMEAEVLAVYPICG